MSAAAGRSRRGTGLAILGVVLALVAVVALSRPRQDPYLRDPLDPRGTGPQGLAASVELLRSYGAHVVLGGLAGADDDVVFQPADRLSGSPQRELAAWVRRGGTLVVTDDASGLGAESEGTGTAHSEVTRPGACTIDALAGVDRLGADLPATLLVEPTDGACFTAPAPGDRLPTRAAVVVHRSGAGLIVTVSSVEPFLDRSLGRDDDAAFAVALLGPAEGRTIRVLDPNRFVSDREVGDGTVLGALPDRGRQALLELGLAFVLWGLVRGRRLGRPIAEELPVAVPGSDLVLAVGELLARGDDLAGVAERLRRRSRRELGIAVGLGADPDPYALTASLTDHVTLAPAEIRRALVEPVADVGSLLDVSRHLDRLREELHDIHAPS